MGAQVHEMARPFQVTVKGHKFRIPVVVVPYLALLDPPQNIRLAINGHIESPGREWEPFNHLTPEELRGRRERLRAVKKRVEIFDAQGDDVLLAVTRADVRTSPVVAVFHASRSLR